MSEGEKKTITRSEIEGMVYDSMLPIWENTVTAEPPENYDALKDSIIGENTVSMYEDLKVKAEKDGFKIIDDRKTDSES